VSNRRPVPQQPGRLELLYVGLALVACLAVFGTHAAGRALEEADRQEGWAALAAGRDAAPDGSGGNTLVAGKLVAGPAQPSEARPAELPPWVQAVRVTRLWSDATDGEAIATVGQWQFLNVVSGDAARLRVQQSALEGGAVEGWVELNDVGLSGPPPEWVRTTRAANLYTSVDGTDSNVSAPAFSDLMVLGEQKDDRVFVYLPVEVTSRRSGYGWIDADAVVPSAQPAAGPLPSPAFHPVPVARQATYRVQVGDSLASIAGALGIARDELLRANGLDAAARLLVGQVLQVPVAFRRVIPLDPEKSGTSPRGL